MGDPGAAPLAHQGIERHRHAAGGRHAADAAVLLARVEVGFAVRYDDEWTHAAMIMSPSSAVLDLSGTQPTSYKHDSRCRAAIESRKHRRRGGGENLCGYRTDPRQGQPRLGCESRINNQSESTNEVEGAEFLGCR
jgi:hypothetical protein